MAESSWPEDVAIGCCNLVANKYLLTVYLSHYIVHFFPTSSPKPVHPCLVFHTSVLFSTSLEHWLPAPECCLETSSNLDSFLKKS